MTDPVVPTLVESVPAAPAPVTPTPPAEVVTGTPETPVVEAPAAEVPATPDQELYELPDGRKVDAQTLQKEWKENFYPEFTRKSQELAQIKNINNPQEVPEWKKPDYVPNSYDELIERGAELALQRLQEKAQQEQAQQQQIAQMVDTQIAEIKKVDPTLDENALFQHANKYGFRDLVKAHENMKHFKQIALDTEQRVLKNVTKRADPVGGPGGGAVPTEGMSPTAHQQYGSALEFFQRVKGN